MLMMFCPRIVVKVVSAVPRKTYIHLLIFYVDKDTTLARPQVAKANLSGTCLRKENIYSQIIKKKKRLMDTLKDRK